MKNWIKSGSIDLRCIAAFITAARLDENCDLITVFILREQEPGCCSAKPAEINFIILIEGAALLNAAPAVGTIGRIPHIHKSRYRIAPPADA